MIARDPIKDPFRESRLFTRRALVAGIFIVMLIIGVLVRMVYLQVVDHQHFSTLSQDNRIRLVAVPPPRGLIYDRSGRLLAENLPSYRLEVVPSQVEGLEQTLRRLGEIIPLSRADLRRFHRQRQRKQAFQSISLRFNLSDREVARFAVNRHEFPGVDIAARPSRYYPRGGSAVHALGYVGRINADELQRLDATNYSGTTHVGKVGIEKYYEHRLHGKVGVKRVEINAQGRTLRTLDEQPPQSGANLVLTLDAELQAAAEQAFGDYNGAAVAMDPNNGEILALVSMPTYDPNDFIHGISTKRYNALRNSHDQPLFNRALTGQYPPGSTIKPFMALAGLQYGETSAGRTIWAPGYYRLPGKAHRYRGWKRIGHGRVDLIKAITQSCDVYFYDLAHRLGIQHMHDFMARFGLGSRIGIDATGERGGIMPSPAWKRGTHGQPWYPGETVIAGIGQGYVLATPLQLATATSMLATHGQRIRPHLLMSTEGEGEPDAQAQDSSRSIGQVELKDSAYWDDVIRAMVNVTQSPHGTAYRIGDDAPYKIAGKTGTAQVIGLAQDEEYDEGELEEKLRDHALFIGFAPADQPRIAVAVVVENGGHGGSVAGPVARKIMDEYLLKEVPKHGPSSR